LQQARDLALAIEDALALHFSRVGGEYRAHERVGEPRGESRLVDALAGDAIERVGEASALRRRARERMDPAAPILVDVLSDVDEVREVAEGADDIERLRDGEVVEQGDELPAHRRRVVVDRAPKPHRGLADGLDACVACLARLRAQHVAEEAAQEPRVLAERQVLVGFGGRRRGDRFGSRRCDGFDVAHHGVPMWDRAISSRISRRRRSACASP
jgi:hypothetical protein